MREYVIEIYNDRWVVLRNIIECRYTNKKQALKEFNELNRTYSCKFRLIQITREVIKP